MWKYSQFSRLVGFISSMVFSASIIFLCSFGIVGIFDSLSEFGLDDMETLSMHDADSIVATITGIAIDEMAVENALVNDIKDIIYGFESKSEYTFEDAGDDAIRVLSNFFDTAELDNMHIEEGVGKLKDSFSFLFDGSLDESTVVEYIREYIEKED